MDDLTGLTGLLARLRQELALTTEGARAGWVVPYQVKRRNKTYTYYHYCFWERGSGKVVKVHLSKKEAAQYREECRRYQEAKRIRKRIKEIIRLYDLLQ